MDARRDLTICLRFAVLIAKYFHFRIIANMVNIKGNKSSIITTWIYLSKSHRTVRNSTKNKSYTESKNTSAQSTHKRNIISPIH